MRHKETPNKRYDVGRLQREGFIEFYQSVQNGLKLRCKYVVSFIGLENYQAHLYGVYEVVRYMPATNEMLPKDFPYRDFINDGDYFYELKEVHGFEDLKGRLIIDWGKGALAFIQWLRADHDKTVVAGLS